MQPASPDAKVLLAGVAPPRAPAIITSYAAGTTSVGKMMAGWLLHGIYLGSVNTLGNHLHAFGALLPTLEHLGHLFTLWYHSRTSETILAVIFIWTGNMLCYHSDWARPSNAVKLLDAAW